MPTTIREKLTPLGNRAKKLRDKGQNWGEIAEELKQGQGKVMAAYLVVTEEPVKSKNENDLRKTIAKLRGKDRLSWAVIAARVDRTEGYCRTAYEEETGTSHRGDRIGKGGRYLGDDNPNPNGSAPKAKKTVAPKTKVDKAKSVAKAAREKAAAKKTTKKAPAKKAAPAKATTSSGRSAKKSPLLDMTLGEMKDRLEGETIVVAGNGGKETKFEVKAVKSTSDGVLEFVDNRTGNTRNVRIEDIKSASTSA